MKPAATRTRNRQPQVSQVKKATAAELYQLGVEIAIIVLLALWTIYVYFLKSDIDSCWWDRNQNSKERYFSLTTNILFFTSVCTMIFCFFQLAIWNPAHDKSQKHPHSFTTSNLFNIFTTLVWYLVTYAICILGKEILDDKNCSHTRNSISGHYTFHIYYFLSLPYVYLSVKAYQAIEIVPTKSKGWFHSNRETILILTFAVFAISTSTTLMRTLIYGYHSIRQIFYGALLALVSHYFSIICRPYFSKYPLAASGLISFTLASLIYHSLEYGPFPLYSYEKVAYFIAWAGMMHFAWAHQKAINLTQKQKSQ
jgi:hypothetical protein